MGDGDPVPHRAGCLLGPRLRGDFGRWVRLSDAARRCADEFCRLTAELQASLPDLRGRMEANQPMQDITWFRVGGPAQILFTPADEADLAYVLAHLRGDLPVTTSASAPTCWCATAAFPAW